MITLGDKIFTNIKYGTNETINHSNFIISKILSKIDINNKYFCNDKNIIDKLKKLKNGL